jgi:integrase
MWVRLLDACDGDSADARKRFHEARTGGITLGEAFEQHLAQLTNVGPYQMKRYRSAIAEHFTTLTGRTVAGITRTDITTWVNQMRKKPGRYGAPMAAKTIANHHGLLSACMTTAVILGYRPDNPCKGVKLPKSAHTEEIIRFITPAEWAKIMEHMDPHFRPFFQFLVGTGLRFGEATALMARDFVLDGPNPSVTVSKAWKEDDEKGFYIGPPKTKKSRRTVSLAPSTVDAVRPLVEAAGAGYVFKLKRGGVMRSGSTYNRAWEPALKKAGYAKTTKDGAGNSPRIHDIRHTHASWLLQAGMEIFPLSRRLGHESVTVSIDRYSHLMPDASFQAAQIAQKALES